MFTKPSTSTSDPPKEDDEEKENVKTAEQVATELKVEKERKVEEAEQLKIRNAAKLKKGDYVVQVHVIECRDVKARDFGNISDPVVIIKCLDQKRATKIHKKCFNCVFDEVFTFEFNNMDPLEIEQIKLNLSVYDANVIMKDVLIGSYEFDLSTIYSQKNHEFYRRWLALSDVTDEFEGVQGYLKVSAVVLGPDDEQYIHTDLEAQDDDGSSMLSVMLPPSISAVTKMLKVSIYDCLDMPRMDEDFGIKGLTLCDPYLRIDFAGITAKTDHKAGQNVCINQVICLPVMEPILSSNIKFSMYDWDATSSDDRIATCLFDYSDVKARKFDARWIHLYGAPEDYQKGVGSKMNRGIIPGSFYRGRCLVGMEVLDVKDPKLTVDTSGLMDVYRPIISKYIIQCDVYEGSEILDSSECWIEVFVQRSKLVSAKLPSKDGVVSWYEQLSLPNGEGDLSLDLPDDLLQCPDIYVYLCTKKGKVSFYRTTFASVVSKGWSNPPTWRSFSVCKALDALPVGSFAGAVLFSLRVGLASTCPLSVLPESRPFNPSLSRSITSTEKSAAPTPSPASPALGLPPIVEDSVSTRMKTLGKLTISIKEGKDFPALDNGSIDPFVKVVVGESSEMLTQVIKRNCNPVFNESFVFENFCIDNLGATPIQVKCYDYNFVKNAKFGDVVFDIRSAFSDDHNLGDDFNISHEILCSETHPQARLVVKLRLDYYDWTRQPKENASNANFKKLREKVTISSLSASANSVITKNILQKGPKEVMADKQLARPSRKQYQLRAHIYQARELPAVDSNGLCDPYIIISSGGKQAKTSIIRENSNPSWFTTLTFNVSLPYPNELAPDIMIYVWDHDFAESDDTLGHFSVNVKEARNNGRSPEDIGNLKPKWYKLRDNNYEDLEGQVLAYFQLVEVQLSHLPTPNLRPVTKPYNIEVVMLGLRDLSATFKINKPQLNFQVPLIDNQTKTYSSLPSCVPDACNPNYLAILKIPVDLPLDPLFAPVIKLTANDTLLGGIIERLIGNAALDLSPFMKDADGDGDLDTNANIEILDEVQLKQEIAAELEVKRIAAENAAKEKQSKEEEERRVKAEIEIKKKMDSEAEEKTALKAAPVKNSGGKRSTYNTADLPSVGTDDVIIDTKEDLDAPLLNKEKNSNLDAKAKAEIEAERNRLNKIKDADEEKKQQDLDDSINQIIKVDMDAPIDVEPDEPPVYMKGREKVDDELEDFLQIGPTKRVNAPFQVISFYTGQKNAKFDSQKFRRSGYFKGLIRLQKPDVKSDEISSTVKQLLQPKKVFVRVYILQGHRLNPKDDNGSSDPYLRVSLGDQHYDTSDHYIPTNLDPDFYEAYEFPAYLPGDSRLKITVMDHDGFQDDEIGSTSIDLEDRWFSKAWRKLPIKPVEFRTLHNSVSTAPQGKISMFVDILSVEEAKAAPMHFIKPPPPQQFELRAIIWKCFDVVNKDDLEEMNDLYVTGQIDTKDVPLQSTDTHLRAQGGKGSFNWRMKFPISLPCRNYPRFKIQLWDMDVFAANDSICEIEWSLKGLCRKAAKTNKRVRLTKNWNDKIVFDQLMHPEFPGSQGAVECSFELMPLALASSFPAGLGRDAPNQNPHLPPPEGRVDWSFFHPFDMLRACLGDKLCMKLGLIFLLACFASALYFVVPMIVSQIVASKVTQ